MEYQYARVGDVLWAWVQRTREPVPPGSATGIIKDPPKGSPLGDAVAFSARKRAKEHGPWRPDRQLAKVRVLEYGQLEDA